MPATATKPETTEAHHVVPEQPLEPPPPVFAFPSKSRCPRCQSLNTVRTTDRGRVQYRRCRVPICRRTYKVIGEEI